MKIPYRPSAPPRPAAPPHTRTRSGAASAAPLAVTAVAHGARPRVRALLCCAVAGALALSLAGQAGHGAGFRREPAPSPRWVADRSGRTFDAHADRLPLRSDATATLPHADGHDPARNHPLTAAAGHPTALPAPAPPTPGLTHARPIPLATPRPVAPVVPVGVHGVRS
ncbi:hypothetical protein [Streptomyces sp. SGAir0957]